MRIKIINTDNNVNNDENNRYIEYNSYYGKQYCYNNYFHKSSQNNNKKKNFKAENFKEN